MRPRCPSTEGCRHGIVTFDVKMSRTSDFSTSQHHDVWTPPQQPQPHRRCRRRLSGISRLSLAALASLPRSPFSPFWPGLSPASHSARLSDSSCVSHCPRIFHCSRIHHRSRISPLSHLSPLFPSHRGRSHILSFSVSQISHHTRISRPISHLSPLLLIRHLRHLQTLWHLRPTPSPPSPSPTRPPPPSPPPHIASATVQPLFAGHASLTNAASTATIDAAGSAAVFAEPVPIAAI